MFIRIFGFVKLAAIGALHAEHFDFVHSHFRDGTATISDAIDRAVVMANNDAILAEPEVGFKNIGIAV